MKLPIILILASFCLAACETTTTTDPAPIGQAGQWKTPQIRASGTMESGAARSGRH
jgi:hypothetical protein